MRKLILVTADELPANNVFGRDLDPRDYRRHLGQTRDTLYWDAGNGLYANAFAALAGTLSGALHLHLPAYYTN